VLSVLVRGVIVPVLVVLVEVPVLVLVLVQA
jgi:hypothetical protein